MEIKMEMEMQMQWQMTINLAYLKEILSKNAQIQIMVLFLLVNGPLISYDNVKKLLAIEILPTAILINNSFSG